MIPSLWASTPLSQAIEKKNKEQVKKLISSGANVNEKLEDGSTPLIKAIETANNAIVELLVSKGADLNMADGDGVTPLMKAAEKNNMSLCKLLVNRRVNVNAKASNGTTALFYLADSGNKDMVSLLLGRGAEVNVVNQEGDSPLHRAALSQKIPVFMMILAKLSEKNTDDPMKPFLLASFKGDKKAVMQFLSSGKDANESNVFGETPLFWAMKGGHDDIAELLSSHGADGKPFGRELYNLISGGKYALARQLINAGADVNIGGHYGYTPLMRSVTNKNAELVQLILEKGGNPNARDVEGYTALMFAASGGDQKVLDLMLNAQGVNIDQVNNHGVTALSAVIDKKTPKRVIEAMLKAGAKPVVGKEGSKSDAISEATKKKCFDLKAMMEKYQ